MSPNAAMHSGAKLRAFRIGGATRGPRRGMAAFLATTARPHLLHHANSSCSRASLARSSSSGVEISDDMLELKRKALDFWNAKGGADGGPSTSTGDRDEAEAAATTTRHSAELLVGELTAKVEALEQKVQTQREDIQAASEALEGAKQALRTAMSCFQDGEGVSPDAGGGDECDAEAFLAIDDILKRSDAILTPKNGRQRATSDADPVRA